MVYSYIHLQVIHVVTGASMKKDEYIALTRFGFGVSSRTTLPSTMTAQQWLKRELLPVNLAQSHSSTAQALATEFEFRQLKQQIRKASEPKKAELSKQLKALQKRINQNYRSYLFDVVEHASQAELGINWRLFDFFSNHFSVTVANRTMKLLAPTMESTAIGPNFLGSFADLLLAVIKHPAMLLYLNNERSIGPNSKVGKRKSNAGINENLAREILELHTLGVNGGYQQQDVEELAKGITGWTLGNLKKKQYGFRFNPSIHEPGSRTVFGKHFPQQGEAQGEAILTYLANRPETAKFVSYKLAKHFISDSPDEKLVTAMTKAWQASGGNIKAVVSAMIEADESWLPQPQKFKTPREFYISSLRAAGLSLSKRLNPYYSLRELGQLPFNAGSPAGYEDSEPDWLSSSSMLTRTDWSVQFASLWQRKVNSLPTLIHSLFSDDLSELSKNSVLRAESKVQALTLLLMSPEFQRR